MFDPLVLNQTMPSEEYVRYAAFWTLQIRVVILMGILTVVAGLLAHGVITYWAVRAALLHATRRRAAAK